MKRVLYVALAASFAVGMGFLYICTQCSKPKTNHIILSNVEALSNNESILSIPCEASPSDICDVPGKDANNNSIVLKIHGYKNV